MLPGGTTRGFHHHAEPLVSGRVQTVLPLVHWLPKKAFRALMARTGRRFFAEEANLNLMTAAELAGAAAAIDGFAYDLSSVPLGGWPSDLLLNMRRSGAHAG